MAEDLGHFTHRRNLLVKTNKAQASLNLVHPDSGAIIASLSPAAAEDLAEVLSMKASWIRDESKK